MNRPYSSSKQSSQKSSHNPYAESFNSNPVTGYHQQNSNPNKLNVQNQSKHNRSSSYTFDPKELICTSADDTAVLLSKNKKLIQLVVQSSAKIAELNEIKKNQEDQHNLEKQEWLSKLDKITDNYKTYAESYQNFLAIQSDYDHLYKEHKKLVQLEQHYESLIKLAIAEVLSCYKKVNFYLGNDKMVESPELSKDYFIRTKEEIKEKLFSFNKKIDPNTFEDLYQQIEFLKVSTSKKDILAGINIPKGDGTQSKLVRKDTNEKSLIKKEKEELIFTKKESFQGSKHNRQRSYEPNSLSTGIGESRQEVKKENKYNFAKEVLSQPINIEEQTKENTHDNSEYTPQFITTDDKQKITATALYDFVPQRKTELGFKKGDLIEIEIIKDNGWWQGNINGQRGLIPYNYIRINE